MPALDTLFSSTPTPERIYLDTDVVISHLVSSQPHHARCRAFLERLALEGGTRIYLSAVSWLEILHTFRDDSFRRALPSEWQSKYSLRRWHQLPIRQQYLTDALSAVETLLADFEWYEIPVTPATRAAACALVVQYNLAGQDAIHLACAAAGGVLDFASLDKDFRRVDGLMLWNDQIHGLPRRR